ncbi:hypothetical protein ma107 [Moumouvirus australiensis]|uniref:Uncharacterized protein n=1 Tax=Moumouvirus australiensis TaxID=2109587 RepID=A0A2P1EKS8_9VIRU|nr:hypothetical protein QKC55_gp797 [Moumouvirus australiensis]AVL94493.1 hypothetical protein ma107 [Moumouvirus australiensis]
MNRNIMFARRSSKFTSIISTQGFNNMKTQYSRSIYTRRNTNINKKVIIESLDSFMDGFTNGCLFGSVVILCYINM